MLLVKLILWGECPAGNNEPSSLAEKVAHFIVADEADLGHKVFLVVLVKHDDVDGAVVSGYVIVEFLD